MRDSPATSDTRSCQDTLAASLACYYADASRQPPRPHCKRVAVVAYGTIALCRSCDQMRSAVGRTHSARPLPGAQLHQLITAARAVGDAERHVAEGVRQAREAGASWAQIGDALDISRQAAQQRWSAPDNHAGVNRP